ncbi:ASKHA domain-containing protein [Desulfosporosinus youngiae]|uniref:Putative metal-binding protein n=1 Tax=Desulfosporosinus youngiae DSM 17734 TaxID=768710 RepID=H5Y3F2_9FIRM|nr:ASKHA domain-containing protein [Desulfosporosinus youngiae]EHQ89061.1 putative metal-binding protein [Desulfosporosinus youngiae DSM 17734]
MVDVTFLPSSQKVSVPQGSTILQAAIEAGVRVESTCGGKGTCGKCKVQLSMKHLSPISKVETRFLSAMELEEGFVLACQRELHTNTVVKVQEQKEVLSRKTDLKSTKEKVALALSLSKHFLSLTPPGVEDQTPDWERVTNALPFRDIPFDRSLAATLPSVLRRENFRVTVVLDHREIVSIEPGDTRSRSFGLAIDIGTTTVVAYLLDLNQGIVLGNAAVTNPQAVFGADVISRITHAASNPNGLLQLQEKVIGGLNHLIGDLCQKYGVKAEEIYQATVVGNTTMSHLFLGIDPTYLAPAPFIPVFCQPVEIKAKELGLKILAAGKVFVLPNVAGYVGSDTIGAALAVKIDQLSGITLVIDIGTNGEMILAGKGKLFTCSTAAGPAFEGAEIKFGMRAAEGAIEGVRIREDVELKIIADARPRGICGSGLIDAIAEMARVGILDKSGRMAGTPTVLEQLSPKLRARIRGKEFVLVWAGETEMGEDIVLTQKDIRELQLAKAAIMAGVRILLKEMDVEMNEIQQVLLAGAFGNFIKKESALGIGLLPKLPPERISAIGNAAGDGAKMALLSVEERERAKKIALQAEHIELSNKKEFQDQFIKSLGF